MLVLYTGKDTKLILNEGNYKFKQSLIDRVINILLSWNIFLMIICLGVPLTCYTADFVNSHMKTHLYLEL
jgi:hypothetical protein